MDDMNFEMVASALRAGTAGISISIEVPANG